LTVMRPDGVSQVIGVDEQTSFKRGGRGMAAIASGGGVVEMGGGGTGAGRGNGAGVGSGAGSNSAGAGAGGGESITFADVKVGDSVAGRGALKSGLFVPTELGVMDPAAMGQRRRRGDTGGTGTAPAGTTAPSGTVAPKGPATAGTVPQAGATQ
jgi:hypothetical protein